MGTLSPQTLGFSEPGTVLAHHGRDGPLHHHHHHHHGAMFAVGGSSSGSEDDAALAASRPARRPHRRA